jgi:hypothetical protein
MDDEAAQKPVVGKKWQCLEWKTSPCGGYRVRTLKTDVSIGTSGEECTPKEGALPRFERGGVVP